MVPHFPKQKLSPHSNHFQLYIFLIAWVDRFPLIYLDRNSSNWLHDYFFGPLRHFYIGQLSISTISISAFDLIRSEKIVEKVKANLCVFFETNGNTCFVLSVHATTLPSKANGSCIETIYRNLQNGHRVWQMPAPSNNLPLKIKVEFKLIKFILLL